MGIVYTFIISNSEMESKLGEGRGGSITDR